MSDSTDRTPRPDGHGVLINVDIVRAGALWTHDPVLAWEAMAQFDTLLDTLLEDHGGERLESSGDQTLLWFERIETALMWSTRMQEGLLATEWPDNLADVLVEPLGTTGTGQDLLFDGVLASMAIHKGSKETLLSITRAAYPGQVLVSGPAWDSIETPLPPELQPRPLGDLLIGSETIPVHQVLSRMLSRRRFPPMASTSPSLAPESDWFIGRRSALEALSERFEAGARLVHMDGPEAVGKSRVALHFAHQNDAMFPGGVWFCDLVGTQDQADLVIEVVRTLGLALGTDASGSPIDRIGHAIASRGRCLVILDGFDAHVDHATETLGHWVRATTDARFLVTSRAPIQSELATHLHLDVLTDPDMRALFLARAYRHQAGDHPPDDVDQRLGDAHGRPLAIEEAARHGAPSAPGNTAPTSTNGLTGQRHLALDPDSLPEQRVSAALDLQSRLRKMGLLSIECDLLDETQDALLDMNDPLLVARWHAARIDALCEKREWSAASTALDEAKEATKSFPPHGQAMVLVAAGKLWAGLEQTDEAREALEQACTLAADDESTSDTTKAQIQAALGEVLQSMGDHDEAIDSFGAAIEGFEQNLPEQAAAQAELGRLCFSKGRITTAQRLLDSALDTAKAADLPQLTARILGYQADVATFSENFELAHTHHAESLSLLQRCGDRIGQAKRELDWGRLRLSLMNSEDALPRFTSALAIARESGLRPLEACCLAQVGIATRIAGDVGSALDHFAEAIAVARAEEDSTLEGFIHAHRGAVEASWDRIDAAEEAFKAAQDLLEQSGDALYSTVIDVLAGFIDVARGREAATRDDHEAHGAQVELALSRLARASSFETRSTPPRGQEEAGRLADLRVARLLLDQALSTLIPEEPFPH